jgi:acyl-CoA thioesterase
MARTFGGQVADQALMAAVHTVDHRVDGPLLQFASTRPRHPPVPGP